MLLPSTCEDTRVVIAPFVKQGFHILLYLYTAVCKNNLYTYNLTVYDSLEMLAWVKKRHPYYKQIWLIGFEYGALIALQTITRSPDISGFVLVSLPEEATKDSEVVKSKLLKQALTPSIQNTFRFDTQLTCTVHSYDNKSLSIMVMSTNAASLALYIAGVPINMTVGVS